VKERKRKKEKGKSKVEYQRSMGKRKEKNSSKKKNTIYFSRTDGLLETNDEVYEEYVYVVFN
jgi:hypothetical protein